MISEALIVQVSIVVIRLSCRYKMIYLRGVSCSMFCHSHRSTSHGLLVCRTASINIPIESHEQSPSVTHSTAAELDDREKLRRQRISDANTGKVPWNKGRNHSKGGSSIVGIGMATTAVPVLPVFQ